MSFIFFVEAVPKDSQRFPKRCASTFFLYAVRFALHQALHAARQLRHSFIFVLVTEC